MPMIPLADPIRPLYLCIEYRQDGFIEINPMIYLARQGLMSSLTFV